MYDKLHLTLTTEDIEDLHNVVGTINAMTSEGVEVIANPDDFTQAVWASLDKGGAVTLDMEIIGQRNLAEVVVIK